MKIKWIVICLAILLLATGVGMLYQGATAHELTAADDTAPQSSQAAGDLVVKLNEVMPKPASGQAEWVELYVEQTRQWLYMPFVTAPTGGYQALNQAAEASSPPSLQLPSAASIDLSGWQVSNEQGQVYTLPDAVPPVPKDTYILIHFDGTGPGGNDYDPADQLIVLHTPAGLSDIFPAESGQAALYQSGARSADTIEDFLAWGGFDQTAGANALAAGIWGPGQAASFENGFGDISQEDILEADESLGRHPGATGFGVDNWANYPSGYLTPGSANPAQPVLFITPENGAKVDATTLSLSWRASAGASGYQFQLDDNSNFSSPLVNTATTAPYYKPDPALPAGIYYWRVNPLIGGTPTGWSGAAQIEAVSFASLMAPQATIEKVLGIARVRQNKDSYLLGLDGAPEGDPTTNTPEDAWDSPAPCTTPPCTDDTKYMHGNMYCVRASIRMMASYYSGSLTMDRISYYILQEWSGNTHPNTNDSNPDNDLGYNRGAYYPDEEDEGFSWALNTTYTTPGGKPTFANVKTWIDANRPIMFRRPGHMMVIDGYRQTDGGDEYLHVLDPDQPPDFERWQDYSTQTIDGYWVGPTSGTARSDESSVSTDSDGDGIMDFDEVQRFFTDPYDTDSDGDWVPDKQDMREYVFDNSGNYNHRGSDWDSDGIRKELDVDNDADGTPDGCEDTNYNGKYESGLSETDNFNGSSSQACSPIFDILYPLQTEPANAGDNTDPDKLLVQVSTAVPNGWTLSLTASDFSVDIGGSAASVVSLYTAADTTFLVVDPPTQSSAAYYDLTVSLSGSGSDHETNAVFYLPHAPNDEVIVLDRSGSMLTDDKIGAAKNAANAFIDFLNDGDWVGVTSFASSASTDYPLTEITGASIRTDAISATNGLSAGGLTALGQGVQQGYGLLTAQNNSDDDWSLVLLSDGWENVSPYWSSVKSSITDAVVHTVALGDGADTTLLQSIAGEKHGNYFYVDVNPPAAATDAYAPTAGPPLAIANTLPNRLADVYLSIGEWNEHLQRLYSEVRDVSNQETQTFQVDIPPGLPEVIFHANWDNIYGWLTIATLTDPSGGVTPDSEYRSNTHHQVRVKNPKPGLWTVNVRVLKPTQELHFSVSGKSDTSLIAAIGGDPLQRFVGVPVPIYGVLSDFAPIKGASVQALVSGPGVPGQPGVAESTTLATLPLYDDGLHGDGKAGDGLYANTLAGPTKPGGYNVKVVATGTDNAGEPFLRYANTGFNVRRRVAYVWNDDEATLLSYEKLIRDAGLGFTAVRMDKVAKTDFSPFDAVIIGPDSGYLGNWGTTGAVNAIVTKERPVLGLGEGGYAFFGKLNLAIGYGNGAHGAGTAITWSNGGDSIWNHPYNISLPKIPLQLYQKTSSRVDIYLSANPPTGVLVFGYNDNDRLYGDVLMESGWWMLWGFNASPDTMTTTGKRLFINTLFRTMQ